MPADGAAARLCEIDFLTGGDPAGTMIASCRRSFETGGNNRIYGRTNRYDMQCAWRGGGSYRDGFRLFGQPDDRNADADGGNGGSDAFCIKSGEAGGNSGSRHHIRSGSWGLVIGRLRFGLRSGCESPGDRNEIDGGYGSEDPACQCHGPGYCGDPCADG